MKTIAICTDIELFNKNRMFDYEFAKKYFGLVSVYHFYNLLKDRCNIVTGDIALEMIKKRDVNPSDIIVIQEQDSALGEALIEKGALPHTIICLESQIYARNFYKKLKTLPQQFKNRIFFDGLFEHTKNCDEKHNFHAYFPSYDYEEILPIQNWEKRDFASLVMGNKYVENGNTLPKNKDFKTRFKWARKLIYKNSLDRYVQKNEQQNKRLEFIEFFGEKGLLKLYGKDWESLNNLPLKWIKRLDPIVKRLNPQPIGDKFKPISECKFNLCIENLCYKGYITEKVIHSFVAGSIPVYLGAPNVEKYIPKNCFIDVRDFKNLDELFGYMKDLSPEKAQEYLKNGRDFLNSEEGQKYSFKDYAKFLAGLVSVEEKINV